MKKILLLILVIGLFFISCSKENESQQTSVNVVQPVNAFRLAEDFTDDAVENFLERSESEKPYLSVFYYKVAEKKVIINSKDTNGNEVFLDSFDVDSEKNGDLICHNQNLNCTFRFLAGEVHQIYTYSTGYRRVRYFKK